MSFEQKLKAAEKHLIANDKKLAPIVKAHRPTRLRPHTDYYSALIRSIVGQQLSVAAARTIWNRVLEVFDGKLPTPEQLVEVDKESLRTCGVSYAKINYMKDLGQHILDGRLDMAHITTLPNDEVIAQLAAVKGIGDWSAHMFMIFTLGCLDILPVGDLGIRKASMHLYSLKELPDKPALEELAIKKKWHPFESVAAWYLWQSLDNAPATTRHKS